MVVIRVARGNIDIPFGREIEKSPINRSDRHFKIFKRMFVREKTLAVAVRVDENIKRRAAMSVIIIFIDGGCFEVIAEKFREVAPEHTFSTENSYCFNGR